MNFSITFLSAPGINLMSENWTWMPFMWPTFPPPIFTNHKKRKVVIKIVILTKKKRCVCWVQPSSVLHRNRTKHYVFSYHLHILVISHELRPNWIQAFTYTVPGAHVRSTQLQEQERAARLGGGTTSISRETTVPSKGRPLFGCRSLASGRTQEQDAAAIASNTEDRREGNRKPLAARGRVGGREWRDFEA